MPEQISKYPDVTLKVLKEAGARCGEGVEQKILKQCPAQQFCSLPSGELCIYGINDIPKMTQISAQELGKIVCPSGQTASPDSLLSPVDFAMVGATLIVGITMGGAWRKFKRRKK